MFLHFASLTDCLNYSIIIPVDSYRLTWKQGSIKEGGKRVGRGQILEELSPSGAVAVLVSVTSLCITQYCSAIVQIHTVYIINFPVTREGSYILRVSQVVMWDLLRLQSQLQTHHMSILINFMIILEMKWYNFNLGLAVLLIIRFQINKKVPLFIYAFVLKSLVIYLGRCCNLNS